MKCWLHPEYNPSNIRSNMKIAFTFSFGKYGGRFKFYFFFGRQNGESRHDYSPNALDTFSVFDYCLQTKIER